MLERLHIRNYRVFNNLKIDQLSRINLIAGKNNSGKTSLLEAIFLLSGAGNTQLAMNIMAFRGIDSVSGKPEAVRETFWKPIFSALDMNKTVEIVGHHASIGQLALTIMLDKAGTTELLFNVNDTVETPLAELADVHQLTFSFTSKVTGEAKGRMRTTGRGFRLSSLT